MEKNASKTPIHAAVKQAFRDVGEGANVSSFIARQTDSLSVVILIVILEVFLTTYAVSPHRGDVRVWGWWKCKPELA
jgi:hypothetical protein